MSLFVDLVFPLPLLRAFTYALPEAWREAARRGARARAPLGTRTATGFIVRVHGEPPAAEAKPLLEIIDNAPLVPEEILLLAERLSRRFCSSMGEMLETALPPSSAPKSSLYAALTEEGRAAFADGKVEGDEGRAAALLASRPASLTFLKRRTMIADVSAVVSRLVRKGWAETRIVERKVGKAEEAPPALSPVQLGLDFRTDAAIEGAARAVAAVRGGSSDFLFFGPADRRAAAYTRCARGTLDRGKDVLFLVPEVGLSAAVSAAFASALGERAVVLHGGQTGAARERALRRLGAASPAVVAGPRSILFTPLRRLGLVIVDEESDESYVQTASPAYDARAGARMRAEIAGAALVLGAEAPSIEAYEKAREAGRLMDLRGGAEPRRATIVDDRSERGLLAGPLAAKLKAALEAGRRVLVFGRRKGYASFLFCPRCGHIPACDSCDAPLSFSRRAGRLLCRVCGAARPAPAACPRCGGRIMEPRGAGVEAVEEELGRLFPSVRVGVFDSDRTRDRGARERALARFAGGKTPVLVGTALLAHRTDVPPASLVVILNPEGLLALADFRAGARLYNEVRRPLRFLDGTDPGAEAVLQTSLPGHPALRAAADGDYEKLWESEMGLRRAMRYPPFAAMAELFVRGRDARILGRNARDLAARLRQAGPDVEVLGPSFTPFPRLGGETSVQLVVKAGTAERLDGILFEAIRDSGARVSVNRAD